MAHWLHQLDTSAGAWGDRACIVGGAQLANMRTSATTTGPQDTTTWARYGLI